MMGSLADTLGNNAWMKENSNKIKSILPETWTHIQNLNMLHIGFRLKLLGVDWRSEDDLGKCMVFFERTGLMLRDGMAVRAKP